MSMLIDFLFSSLVLAALGRIWKKFLKDFPTLKIFVKNKLPELISRALCCSFCFTFWISLMFVLLFNPLHDWLPMFRFNYLNNFTFFISIFFSWMILGSGAWIIRFLMDELQLLVHYQNHILKEKSGHK